MPGREDFAIIRARLVADERAHVAAAQYVACGLAVEATALSTVIGHVAQLSLWAMRETNSGILPGDGVSTVSVATLSPRSVAQETVKCLISSGLLRAKGTGLYIAGFRDCYSSIVAKRKADRARVASKREEQKSQRSRGDVAATSERRSGDVAAESQRTVPCRAVPCPTEPKDNPPTPNGGGGSTSSPHEPQAPRTPEPLSTGDRYAFEAIYRGMAKSWAQTKPPAVRSRELRATLLTPTPDADGIREFVTTYTPSFAEEVLDARRTAAMEANGRRAAGGGRK